MVGTLPFAHTAFIKMAEDELFCLDKLLRTNFTPFSMQQIEKKDKTKKDRKKKQKKKDDRKNLMHKAKGHLVELRDGYVVSFF